MNSLGHKIKDRRWVLRMSQEDLAKKSGVSRQTISMLECNPNRNVSTRTLEKIAAALDMTIAELFS